ncbi:MAG: hypothetical protein QM658_16535 [Gordonia sp. (in: high G+C Gram-positive bacteria)]
MRPPTSGSEIPVLYPFRAVDDARTSVTELPNRRLRLTIDHEPLAGVTQEMLLWWFRNIGGDMEYAGGRHSRYRVWHPLDHISWDLRSAGPSGQVGEGSRFHIVEEFGQDPAMRIDSIDTVEKLDRTGIRLVLRVAGIVVFQLEHTWSAGHDATHYVSVLDLGARTPLMRPVNAYLRRRVFRSGMENAWIKHNIEEVGRFEHFLPELWAAHTGGSIGPRPPANPDGRAPLATKKEEEG